MIDQDIATVRDVLRVFGGRHACAAFDRIVGASQGKPEPQRPPSMPPTQAELTATLTGNKPTHTWDHASQTASGYEPEPIESEE